MSRRNVWSGEETMEMLEIIKEKNLMELFTMNSRTLKADCDVYKIIEEEMKMNGFPLKDSGQIYHKWKNLKRAFYISRKTNQGTPNCEFAQELKEILEQQCLTSREVLEQRRKQSKPATTIALLRLFIVLSHFPSRRSTAPGRRTTR